MESVFYIEADEAKHIIISVIALSFAFTILYTGGIGSALEHPSAFFLFGLLSMVTVGSGFILHEMAHKVAAIHYGAYARFTMWMQGLVLMVITSLFGFLFAAPGAVYIYSQQITKKENGIISIVGPLVNIAIAVIFLLLNLIKPILFNFPFFGTPFSIWEFGARINIMLGLFNMIPAFPLDGSKVFMWNKFVWGAFIGITLLFGVKLFGIGLVISWGILLVLALLFSKLLF